MKLLGIAFSEHDSNITITNNSKIKYYKSERFYDSKHHSFQTVDNFYRFIKDNKIDLSDIDEAAIVCDNSKIIDDLDFNFKITRIDHHFAHSLSVWPLVDTDNIKTAFVFDGMGDNNIHHSIFKNNSLLKFYNLQHMPSIGMEYGKLGTLFNMKGHTEDYAGKIMALQSYGKILNDIQDKLKQKSFLNTEYVFNINVENKLNYIKNVHHFYEQNIVSYFKKFSDNKDFISFTGGVALNICFNSQLKKYFDNIILVPHCNDEGLSLGCVEYLRRQNNLDYFDKTNFPYWQSDEVPTQEPTTETIKKTAELLAKNKIVAWYQGSGELGPRALGNRSILMNPLTINGKQILNDNIKFRESFRPFGASIISENVNEYFEEDYKDYYMLYQSKLKANLNNIRHIDGTSRIQSVTHNHNKLFYELLYEFKKLTGLPILLNTSFNIQGKPIISKTNEAIEMFKNSKLDNLILGNNIY